MPENIWNLLDDHYAEDEAAEQAAASRISEAVLAHASRRDVGSRGYSPGTVRRPVRYVSGALIVVLSLVVFWKAAGHDLSRLLMPAPQASIVKEYRTAAGQRMSVTLPDGSKVALAPESHLRYAVEEGNSTNRVVVLDGQALFNVAHSADAAFIVRTAGVVTRVLGTSFTVRSYALDHAVKVVVAQGRVAVGGIVLNSGDIAEAVSDDQINVLRNAPTGDHLAWTEGRLVFSRVPLRDAIPELERWYGIKIRLSDSTLGDGIWHSLELGLYNGPGNYHLIECIGS